MVNDDGVQQLPLDSSTFKFMNIEDDVPLRFRDNAHYDYDLDYDSVFTEYTDLCATYCYSAVLTPNGNEYYYGIAIKNFGHSSNFKSDTTTLLLSFMFVPTVDDLSDLMIQIYI